MVFDLLKAQLVQLKIFGLIWSLHHAFLPTSSRAPPKKEARNKKRVVIDTRQTDDPAALHYIFDKYNGEID